jgi:hypothetical protein
MACRRRYPKKRGRSEARRDREGGSTGRTSTATWAGTCNHHVVPYHVKVARATSGDVLTESLCEQGGSLKRTRRRIREAQFKPRRIALLPSIHKMSGAGYDVVVDVDDEVSSTLHISPNALCAAPPNANPLPLRATSDIQTSKKT